MGHITQNFSMSWHYFGAACESSSATSCSSHWVNGWLFSSWAALSLHNTRALVYINRKNSQFHIMQAAKFLIITRQLASLWFQHESWFQHVVIKTAASRWVWLWETETFGINWRLCEKKNIHSWSLGFWCLRFLKDTLRLRVHLPRDSLIQFYKDKQVTTGLKLIYSLNMRVNNM